MELDASGGGGVTEGGGLSVSLLTSTESSDTSDVLGVLARLPPWFGLTFVSSPF